MSISSSLAVISVRRSSPKRSLISASSSLISVHHGRLVAEQLAQLADPLADVVVLALDRVGLERRQLREAQVEDRRRLDLAEPELAHQALARRVAVGARRGSAR